MGQEEEKKRNSVIDRGIQAYNTYQNARSLAKLGKGLFSAARGVGALAATSEIWGPVAIAIGLVALFTVIIMIGTGRPAATAELPPTTIAPQNPGGLFNITIRQDNVSDEQFYNVLKDVFAYSTYTKLLTESGAFNVELYPQTQQGLCSAAVFGSSISFFGLSFCSQSHQRYLALHESGHIIGNRNGRLFQSFPFSELRAMDADCYNGAGYLKSYALANSGSPAGSKDESFAEAIALFITYRERPSLSNFPIQCPNTYNWIGKNIYSQ